MKKIIYTIILCIFFSNNVFANVITLKRCYKPEKFSKFDPTKYIKDQYSINLNTGTVVKFFELTEQELQRQIDSWKKSKYYDGIIRTKKTSTAMYTIEHYDDESIYATNVSKYTTTKVRLNIYSGKVFVELEFYNPYRVSSFLFKCEPAQIASDRTVNQSEKPVYSGESFIKKLLKRIN